MSTEAGEGQLFDGGTSVPAAGAGGAGGAGGRAKVANALEEPDKKKLLVSVVRGKQGFEVGFGFDKQHEVLEPFSSGVIHHVHDGVTLSFHGSALTLRQLDLATGNGAPGGASHPDSRRAWYVLGKKETWQLMETGEVVIK